MMANNNYKNGDDIFLCDYRMIGYSDAACAVTSTYSWFRSLPSLTRVWMNNVQCTGSEETLDRCSFAGWGNSYCSSSSYAGIVCANCKLFSVTICMLI